MFKFMDVKYKTTLKGVRVEGKIVLENEIVGHFYQEPFAACIPCFTDKNARDKFNKTARSLACGNSSNYAERLLTEAENKVLKRIV